MEFGVSADILLEDDVLRDMMACESRDFWALHWSCDLGVFPWRMVVQFMELIECTLGCAGTGILFPRGMPCRTRALSTHRQLYLSRV